VDEEYEEEEGEYEEEEGVLKVQLYRR